MLAPFFYGVYKNAPKSMGELEKAVEKLACHYHPLMGHSHIHDFVKFKSPNVFSLLQTSFVENYCNSALKL